MENDLVYDGGQVKVFQDLPDCVTMSEVKDMINSLGYSDIVKLHYLDPRKDFTNGIRYFGYDKYTFDPFLALLLKYKVINVYTEHEVSLSSSSSSLVGASFNPLFVDGTTNNSFLQLLSSIQNQTPASPITHPVQNQPPATPITHLDIDYDTSGTDEDDAEVMTARDKIKEDVKGQQSIHEELEMLKRLAESKGKNIDDISNEFDGGSDLDSPSDSDDEDCGFLVAPDPSNKIKKNRFLEEGECSRQSKFYVGQTFKNAKTFRKAIINYSIEIGRDIPFKRNDKDRVGAHCINKEEGCPWKIWASWDRGKRNFMVKTLIADHTCGRASKLKKMTSTWIASTYQTKFKVNPYIKLHDIIETIWLEWGIKVSKFMAYRARKKGQALIVGEYKEQFAL
ncbi:Holliday junction ATP-dependent DNA helicase RuvB [Bienertia sinuspersici]